MDVRVFGALTEFGSHVPVGIYQRSNTAKTVRPRYLPARPLQDAYAHTSSRSSCVCGIKYARATRICIRTRTQSHGDSALYRNAVIYSTEMKKELRSQNLTWEFAPSVVVIRSGHFRLTLEIDARASNNFVDYLINSKEFCVTKYLFITLSY